MSFFRYARVTPDQPNRKSQPHPFEKITEKDRIFSDLCYTSEQDDSDQMFIYCIGHQVGLPGKPIRRRVTSSAIFHYVVSGKCYFNGEEVHAGQFFFTYPYEEHTIDHDPRSTVEYYWMSLAGPGTNQLLKKCEFEKHPQIQDFDFADHIVHTLDRALYESHERDTELYFLGICYNILSMHKAMNRRLDDDVRSNRDYVYYKTATQYINDHFNRNISASDVAKHLHISTSYMRLVFKKYCKYSLQELLILKRIEQAKSELEFEDYSIKEIALRTGYHDQSFFTRLFRKYTGQSPSQYRKRHKQESVEESD